MSANGDAFFNLYNHGFARVAVAVPGVRVADPAYNAQQTVALLRQAAGQHCALVAFPELGLTGYSCDDLFHQQALLDAALQALDSVRTATRGVQTIAVVGLPLVVDDRLFNVAAVLHDGRVAGLVPKSYLPGYREYYEPRQFAAASMATRDTVDLPFQSAVPFGARLLFEAGKADRRIMRFAVEICEDIWVPLPPTTFAALAGASVLVNLSASNITVGKADLRHALIRGHSARCLAAYLFTAAGPGESTTDLAWDGQNFVYENGTLLAEGPRFPQQPQLTVADVDVGRLEAERLRQTSMSDCVREHATEVARYRIVPIDLHVPRAERLLPVRAFERYPYVPADADKRDQRCYEAYNIQVAGLAKRLQSTGIQRLVVGISGGLDSTQALIVAARAFDRLELPRKNIVAVTMPGYATSDRTLRNARRLMSAFGCTALEIDIRPACEQMLRDIGHPAADGQPVYDTTFENVQAGARTSRLFRLANHHRAMVLGTGDLSELALGWCTYGVGDHMSHYAVNASIPKTLIQYLIRWVAQQPGEAAREVLLDILETEISPELVPADEAERAGGNQPAQRTEDIIGPYDLHDFALYHVLRLGYAPPTVAFLAWCAWHDISTGEWPDVPAGRRRAFGIGEIRRWLEVFVKRFFGFAQFKRSCIPNAPKVGSGGSLSPRGDWRAPSDSEATAWLATLEQIPTTE